MKQHVCERNFHYDHFQIVTEVKTREVIGQKKAKHSNNTNNNSRKISLHTLCTGLCDLRIGSNYTCSVVRHHCMITWITNYTCSVVRHHCMITWITNYTCSVVRHHCMITWITNYTCRVVRHHCMITWITNYTYSVVRHQCMITKIDQR